MLPFVAAAIALVGTREKDLDKSLTTLSQEKQQREHDTHSLIQ